MIRSKRYRSALKIIRSLRFFEFDTQDAHYVPLLEMHMGKYRPHKLSDFKSALLLLSLVSDNRKLNYGAIYQRLSKLVFLITAPKIVKILAEHPAIRINFVPFRTEVSSGIHSSLCDPEVYRSPLIKNYWQKTGVKLIYMRLKDLKAYIQEEEITGAYTSNFFKLIKCRPEIRKFETLFEWGASDMLFSKGEVKFIGASELKEEITNTKLGLLQEYQTNSAYFIALNQVVKLMF